MTKQEYESLIQMVNSTNEDLELAKGIIKNKFNDSIFIKMILLNTKDNFTNIAEEFDIEDTFCIEELYEEIKNQKDKYKYFFVFEYCIQKRVEELVELARYSTFINNVSISLVDG